MGKSAPAPAPYFPPPPPVPPVPPVTPDPTPAPVDPVPGPPGDTTPTPQPVAGVMPAGVLDVGDPGYAAQVAEDQRQGRGRGGTRATGPRGLLDEDVTVVKRGLA